MIIVNTPTYEYFKAVLELVFARGRKWCDGTTEIRELDWNAHRTSTCIIIRDNYLTYASRQYVFENYKEDILNTHQFRENIRKYVPKNFGEMYDLK